MTRQGRFGRLITAVATAAAGGVVVFGVATPAHAVTIGASSGFNAVVSQFAQATCPMGLNLVGAGGQVNGGGGNVVMTDVIPNVATDAVTVWGHTKGAFGGMWEVVAVAICEPVAGVVQISVTSAFNGAAVKVVNPVCPAGTNLTGLGWELVNGNGEVFPDTAVPAPGLGGATIGATENGAYMPPWLIRGFALCAPPAGFSPQRLAAVNGPNGVSPKQAVTPACPAGTTLFGVGGQLAGAGGDVIMAQMVPNPAQTVAIAGGIEFAPANWAVLAYDICW